MNYLNKKTVEDIDVAGKHVLVRCDFSIESFNNADKFTSVFKTFLNRTYYVTVTLKAMFYADLI